MTELLVPIFIFFLMYLYYNMKKANTSTKKSTAKAKTDKAPAGGVIETELEKMSSTKSSLVKKDITDKPKLKEKTEEPTTESINQPKPEKLRPNAKSSAKIKKVAPITTASKIEITVPERVGLTAGDIWHYLDKNGATPVAKLVNELSEEEKIIQRGVGWLAQEGKISLNLIDHVETIGLVD